MTDYRKEEAKQVRDSANRLAFNRNHPKHQSNGDEERYASANYAMNFTKGLEHCSDTGLIKDASSFQAFRAAINGGFADAFTTSVPSSPDKVRAWEAPTAGVVYDLQGPDAQAVTMPPAPALQSKELAYEMAEVYEFALLRDIPLTDFDKIGKGSAVKESFNRLNNIDYDIDGDEGRERKNNGNGKLDFQTAFRGSSPGVEKGPYLSQFLLIGNNDLAGAYDVTKGCIQYGALQIDQRIPIAFEKKDYMTCWEDWLNVQNGADTRNNRELLTPNRRFITTPRDLATYVHDDALYEAYLNACLILLSMGTPFDPGFDKLSGQGNLFFNSLDTRYNANLETHRREAGGFALWGGPHILTLVTEVATRALKAVRYQKFNTHCRLRPEALAARIEKSKAINKKYPTVCKAFTDLGTMISGSNKEGKTTLDEIRKHNIKNNKAHFKSCEDLSTLLLPMAFQEGSPMHPSYGAGHAAVAGACVTILKAFFDTSSVFVKRKLEEKGEFEYRFDRYNSHLTESASCGKNKGKSKRKGDDQNVAFVASKDGSCLQEQEVDCFLTLEGELNKLAANISIGRNMAGVHYFSDYYDSVRMGEEIALGLLEEQALCYTTDPFILSVPTFDGDVRQIGKR